MRDLMLEDRRWTMEAFRPYADERRERMRRLRMTAAAFSILTAQFGPKARERRKKFRQERARGTFVDVAPAAFIGPEVLPAEAFSEEILDRLRAL